MDLETREYDVDATFDGMKNILKIIQHKD